MVQCDVRWSAKVGAILMVLGVVGGVTGCGLSKGDLRRPGEGTAPDDGAKPGPSADANAVGIVDVVALPPRDYYDFLLTRAVDLVDRDLVVSQLATPPVLWVNFDGGVVPKGFLPGQSFLPCANAAVIPAATLSPAEKDEVVQRVQKYFAAAGVNLQVTASRPGASEFTTVHVGGSAADLGCSEAKGRLGFAPLDPGDLNRADVAFAFASYDPSAASLATVIAHVAGHTFGLDHVTAPNDLMHAAIGPDPVAFASSPLAGSSQLQDGPMVLRQVLGMAPGGATPPVPVALPVSQSVGPAGALAPLPPSSLATTVPAGAVQAPNSSSSWFVPGLGYVVSSSAALPGFAQLRTLGQLASALGPNQILDVSSFAAKMSAVFPSSLRMTSLADADRLVTVLALATQAARSGKAGRLGLAPLAAPGGASGTKPQDSGAGKPSGSKKPPTDGGPKPGDGPVSSGDLVEPALVAALLRELPAKQTPTLERLAAMAGFSDVSAAIKAIQAAVDVGELGIPADEGFPDLAPLLDLSTQVVTVPALFTNFMASAVVVRGSLPATATTGLNALLKIAYVQRYQALVGLMPGSSSP